MYFALVAKNLVFFWTYINSKYASTSFEYSSMHFNTIPSNLPAKYLHWASWTLVAYRSIAKLYQISVLIPFLIELSILSFSLLIDHLHRLNLELWCKTVSKPLFCLSSFFLTDISEPFLALPLAHCSQGIQHSIWRL